MPKNALFLMKNCKNRRRWGIRLQTPLPAAARGFTLWPPASGGWGSAPRPPN